MKTSPASKNKKLTKEVSIYSGVSSKCRGILRRFSLSNKVPATDHSCARRGKHRNPQQKYDATNHRGPGHIETRSNGHTKVGETHLPFAGHCCRRSCSTMVLHWRPSSSTSDPALRCSECRQRSPSNVDNPKETLGITSNPISVSTKPYLAAEDRRHQIFNLHALHLRQLGLSEFFDQFINGSQ